jgi:glyoxylase-like metal-dependent hydrolase (beta-lactamase superfamily II)
MSELITIDCDYVMPQLAAAYLRIEGQQAAFIEANTTVALPRLLAALREAGRAPEDVRYVIVTHAHLDHAGGASALMAVCPNATLLCHPRAARNLIDPAKLVASAIRVYGDDDFRRLYGTITPIAAERVRALEDGERVELGDAELRFIHTAGHAKHHFIVHDVKREVVFTGDAFGLVYPQLQRGRRFAFPSTSPIDFDAVEAHRSVDRIVALAPRLVFPTHFGGYAEVAAIASQVRRWVDVSQAAVEVCIAKGQVDCEAELRSVLDVQLEKEAAAAGLIVSPADRALLEFDFKLNAQGLAVVVSRALNPPQ